MTIREAQLAARAILAHLPDAARDAELLLLHTLGLTRAQLLANPTRELTPEQQANYNTLIARRAAHEPIQYITGTQEFYGLAFKVTPATLIPRPETELLVESVLQRLPHNQPLRMADIGTGTGCIAIALAVHLPQAEITALDLSDAALAIARENSATHHVSQRVNTVHSDLLTAVADQRFDAIVSNPPYIPHADRPTLAAQVRDFEPSTALFADEDGLALYRRLIPQAFALLNPGGLLALEIGYGQSPAIQQMLSRWTDIEVLKDLQGIPRTILATHP